MRAALAPASPALFIRAPELVVRAGRQAEKRYFEFFTAEIRNPNTRKAYATAILPFLRWCAERGIELQRIEPMVVAAYVEMLTRERSAPTVKQHLAAIRMLLDYLVIGQVLPFNPASSVRGPKHVVTTGKTPVLYEGEARALFDSINVSKLVGLRDRAILAIMTYSFARVGAVVRMKVKDFYVQGLRAYFVLNEKGGKFNKVPAHHKASECVEAYLTAAGIAMDREGPLFRAMEGKGGPFSNRWLSSTDVLRMIKRRARSAGLPPEVCCHTFRATGITNYLENGGTLETAARIAGHASTKTTQLYDRTGDKMNLAEIERIRI